MKDICDACHKPIEHGSLILQFARGKYYPGFETPTYASGGGFILFETHADCSIKCFKDAAFDPQWLQPYHCSLCKGSLPHGTEVVYASFGTKPSSGYIRPECRGYAIPLISHVDCWADHPIRASVEKLVGPTSLEMNGSNEEL
jgi:hypothetical protein